jgi:hypothetical protein
MKFNINKFTAGQLAKNPVDGGYENIEFIGYMCKTTFETDGVQETKYFTVNADGRCTGSYAEPHMKPLFEIVDQPKNPFARVSSMKAEEYHIVKVNRFFRRFNQKLNQIESYGGLACIIEMDYYTMLMTVYPAFCSDEENFSKHIGLVYADASKSLNQGIVFKFNKDASIYENLRRAVLQDGYSFTVGMSTKGHIQEMFNRNFNRLFNSIPGKPITEIRAGKQ